MYYYTICIALRCFTKLTVCNRLEVKREKVIHHRQFEEHCCRVFHLLDLADCFPLGSFNMSLCSWISSKHVFSSKILIRFRFTFFFKQEYFLHGAVSSMWGMCSVCPYLLMVKLITGARCVGLAPPLCLPSNLSSKFHALMISIA